MKDFGCPGLVHMPSPHWMNHCCLGIKYSDFVQTGPFGHVWPVKGGGGVNKRMAALPLNHVARERLGGEAVSLAATAMVAGGITGTRKASQFVSVKNDSRGGFGNA